MAHTNPILFCSMASPRAKKRMKTLVQPKASVTSLTNSAFNEKDVAEAKTICKMSFRSPVTIDNVFSAPALDHVKMFYESRASSTHHTFEQLPKAEKVAWTESFHDNKTLMGFIIYTLLFPKLLQTRIKLNAATYHWTHLGPTSDKGKVRLEQRRKAYRRLKRNGVTRSVFRGLSQHSNIDTSANILDFMNINVEEEDERFRFFTKREFSMICSARGQVGS